MIRTAWLLGIVGVAACALAACASGPVTDQAVRGLDTSWSSIGGWVSNGMPSQEQTRSPVPGGPLLPATEPGEACPVQLDGTSVAAIDTPDGVALRFTTTGDEEQLRSRVMAMEVRQNSRSATENDPVPAHAAADVIPGGATIVFRPVRPDQLDEVRDYYREQAREMLSGRCPVSWYGVTA